MRFFILLITLMAGFGTVNPIKGEVAKAAEIQAATLSPSQEAWVERIERKLGEIHTIKAQFRQISADGQISTGTLVLQRPDGGKGSDGNGWGKMRFTYAPPSQLLLVANHGKVVFSDKSIDQVTSLPLQRTPLGLLLQPRPHFSGDVTILSFTEKHDPAIGKRILLRVVKTQNPGEGTLTLYFSTKPLGLDGWDLIDAQGHKTILRLFHVQEDVALSEEMFTLPKEN